MRDGSREHAPPARVPPAAPGLIGLDGAPSAGRGQVVDRNPERRVVAAGIAASAAFLAAAIANLLAAPQGPHWTALHLALAGGGGVAVGALLPHFAVSLAVTRPLRARWRAIGLALLAGGALAAVIGVDDVGGVRATAPWLAPAGAAAYVAGIAWTAGAALLPGRTALGRRRGVVELGYTIALAEVAAGVTLALLYLAAVPAVTGGWAHLKPAHGWLNLVGFLAVVIATTLIHLYPTVVGSRIRARPALLVMVAALGAGAGGVALAYILRVDVLARAGALAALLGVAALVRWSLATFRSRARWSADPAWHRLTIGHLSAAIAWLAIGVAVAAGPVVALGASPSAWSADRIIGPLVLGGVVQALIGSWSHLAPAVGPGDVTRHARQRAILGTWPGARLAGVNLAAALVTAGALAGSAPIVWAGAAIGAVAVALALVLLALALAGAR